MIEQRTQKIFFDREYVEVRQLDAGEKTMEGDLYWSACQQWERWPAPGVVMEEDAGAKVVRPV